MYVSSVVSRGAAEAVLGPGVGRWCGGALFRRLAPTYEIDWNRLKVQLRLAPTTTGIAVTRQRGLGSNLLGRRIAWCLLIGALVDSVSSVIL